MKRRMWMLGALACGTVLAASALGQVTDDAKKVFAESQQAMSKVESMSYKVRKYGTGILKDIIDMDGTVKFWRQAGKPAMVMVTGRIKQPGQSDKKLAIVYDGSTAKWLDWTKNTLFERPVNDQTSREDLDLSKQFVIEQFTSAEPFAKELAWPSLKKEGVDKINGEMCDLVVGAPAGDRKIVWAVSVADRFPRRWDQGTGEGNNKIAMIMDITELKLGQKFTAKDFEIEKPTGFVIDKAGAMADVAPMPGIKGGMAAPLFSVSDTAGKQYDLSGLKGSVVVLQFFNPIIKSCTEACAEVQAIADEKKSEKVVFLGVACHTMSDTAAAEFWKTNRLTFPLIAKGGDDIAKDYKVVGYPSLAVVGADGNVAGFFQNNPGKAEIEAAIKGSMK